MKKPKISIVIPAYNEARHIKPDISVISKSIKKITASYEIIISEDGCTDNSEKILRKLERTHEHVRHVRSDVKVGKGGAITKGFNVAKGNVLLFMDADLSTDLSYLHQLVKEIEGGADIAIGSRYFPGAQASRNLKRDMISRVYNYLVRLLLKSKIYDHQCGFKAFKKESYKKIMDSVKDRAWFWDTEILVKAQQKGFKIKEFPVKWKEGKESKVNTLKVSWYLGINLLKLWLTAK